MFTARYAHRQARRYRRAGLDRTAAAMVAFCRSNGLDGARVLEVGAGVGTLSLELLRAGAAHATTLELSGGYEDDAAALAAEAGLSNRVERHVVDIAVSPDAVPPADVVVLHRVVCCYPDHVALLTAAADHAGAVLVFSYPRPGAIARGLVAAQNALLAVGGRRYRAYVHAPAQMSAVLTGRGLDVVESRRGTVWEVSGAVRSAVANGPPAPPPGRP